MTTATCRVRCDGHLHTISLTSRGALVLHDHPDPAADRAFAALGGEPCRCLQVLAAWRQKDRSQLPADLRAVFDEARARATRRAQHIDPLAVPFVSRAEARVQKLAKDALAQCAYRRSQTTWAGGGHVVRVRIGAPDISGYGDRVWSSNGKWPGTDSHIDATVPLRWFSRVYRRGLAVVDGVFVLDVLAEDEKGITVLAGRQGRGFEVYPCRARITRTADGGYRLRWLKEAE